MYVHLKGSVTRATKTCKINKMVTSKHYAQRRPVPMGGRVDSWSGNYLVECNRQYSVLIEERSLGTTAIPFAISQLSQEAPSMRDIRLRGIFDS